MTSTAPARFVTHSAILYPLHVAAQDQDFDTLYDLLYGFVDGDPADVCRPSVDVNAPDASGNTALHLAVAAGDMMVSDVLITAWANVNAVNLRGNTPLHLAAASGYAELATLLLEEGADPQAYNDASLRPISLVRPHANIGLYTLLSTHDVRPSSLRVEERI